MEWVPLVRSKSTRLHSAIIVAVWLPIFKYRTTFCTFRKKYTSVFSWFSSGMMILPAKSRWEGQLERPKSWDPWKLRPLKNRHPKKFRLQTRTQSELWHSSLTTYHQKRIETLFSNCIVAELKQISGKKSAPSCSILESRLLFQKSHLLKRMVALAVKTCFFMVFDLTLESSKASSTD